MKLEKIGNFINEHGITGKDILYHTWRKLKNRKGEETGELRILALKEDGMARIEYICPYCGEYGYQEEVWRRPFSFKCQHCGKTIRVPRLKDQVKRELKKK